MDTEVEIAVIGAGAAGLVALRELDRAGVNAIGLEARDRIGGRAFTLHDPMSSVPIELGAEFIHGHPQEIFDEAKSARLTVYDVSRRMVHVDVVTRTIRGDDDSGEGVDRLMNELVQFAHGGKDMPFSTWLDRTAYPEAVKRRATAFVEGFNAAHKERIGVASLAIDARASEEIGADRNHRLFSGYDGVMRSILAGVRNADSKLRLNRVVERVEWTPGKVAIHARSSATGDVEIVHCRKAIVTIPLGVLQAEPDSRGAIRFDPEPTSVLEAARSLCFGQVMRVVLRFREAFWESVQELADASFLFSQEALFPTWWTASPVRSSVIVGWSAGPQADSLLDRSESEITEAALAGLAHITLGKAPDLRQLLEAAYLHKWNADPFARGAYSYVPAGALLARDRLIKPVADTLYFAGEATDNTGHGGTVNGAMASGKRAARQVLKSLGLRADPATLSLTGGHPV